MPPGRLLRLVGKDRQRCSNPQKGPLMVLKRTFCAYQCDGKDECNHKWDSAWKQGDSLEKKGMCWGVGQMQPQDVGFSLTEPCSESGSWERRGDLCLFITRPTNVRMWHKAVFKVGPVAGPKPTRVRQGQKYLRPYWHSPFWGTSGARQ